MKSSSIIRSELAKLTHLPPWGRKQADGWDQLSNFIYRINTLAGVQRQAEAVARARGLEIELFSNYVLRRWYNHHTHDQILQLFCAHPDVKPEANPKHSTIDFYLRGLPFDLKISRFPQAYPATLEAARQNPHQLALWQYENQSQQGRYHTGNRLFIVLHDQSQPAQSWQLRRDFDVLQTLIQDFLLAPTLLGLTVKHQHSGEIFQPWSGIIFHTR